MRLLPMGKTGVLAEVGTLAEVIALRAALADAPPEGVTDLVPAARTVLVRFDPVRIPGSRVRTWIESAAASIDPDAGAPASGSLLVVLPVSYDGPDLAETAELLGVDVAELVRRHLAAEWTVAFTGFAPGFGYLASDDWTFDVPRLASPRTRVPAGAVGLAAGFTGAYPRETPGGWRLIATLAPGIRLFDPDAASPALLAPGARVRFVEATPPVSSAATTAPGGDGFLSRPPESPASSQETVAATAPHVRAAPAPAPAATAPPGFRVDAPGLLATVQDLGRPGAASVGVALSGALDRTAHRTANRLVGNPESTATIEVSLGGFRATAERDLWIAVAGAWGPIRIGGHGVDPYEAHAWPRGSTVELDAFAHGTRAYLAVRGGVGVPAALGSRSTDVLAGLGPPPLGAGDVVPVGAEPATPIPAGAIAPWGAPHDGVIELELGPGPRADRFTPDALLTLFDAEWTVTDRADRVGVVLDGPALPRRRDDELPSEGMVPGALQVPPSGRPTVLLADGPVTGGYPVIAVATEASLDRIAQARPGTRIRFRHARPAR